MNDRATHFMLEAQAQPVSRAWEKGIVRPACTGACDQGRKVCPNVARCRNTLDGWMVADLVSAVALVGFIAAGVWL